MWIFAGYAKFKCYFGCFNANENFSISDSAEFACFLWTYPNFRLFWPFFMVSLDVILFYPIECYLDVQKKAMQMLSGLLF